MRKITQDRIKERSEIRNLYISVITHPLVNGDIKRATKITIDEFIKAHPKYQNCRKRVADHIAEYHEPWFILDDNTFISEYQRLKPAGMKKRYNIRPRGANNRYNEILGRLKCDSKKHPKKSLNDNFDGLFDDFSVSDANDSAVVSDGIYPLETTESAFYENGSLAEEEENPFQFFL